jgi:hypothetical protein
MGAMAVWILYEFALDNGEIYEVAVEGEGFEAGGTSEAGRAAPDYVAGLINDAYGYLMLQRLDDGAPANSYALIAARHITRVSWQLVGDGPPERKWQFR